MEIYPSYWSKFEEPMSTIAFKFTCYFGHLSIQLPAWNIKVRQPGKMRRRGWSIQYIFGSDGEEEFLDFYATHRMTRDRHVRIRADGSYETLETPRAVFSYRLNDDLDTIKQTRAALEKHNRGVYERLRKKGYQIDDYIRPLPAPILGEPDI